MEALLNSRTTDLVISSEFARKQGFKLKKIERLIYVRNVEGIFNKKELIEYRVKINIFYKEHKKKTKINMIREEQR